MRNNSVTLVAIIILMLLALYIVLPLGQPTWLVRSRTNDPNVQATLLDLKLGLDLRGGTQVLLEADLPEGQTAPAGAMDTAKLIVNNRVNGLGVSEALVQKLQGEDRIMVELPGINNPDQAVETLRSTGQLEFVDPENEPLTQGMVINTTNHPEAAKRLQESAAAGVVLTEQPYQPERVFNTVMTGDVLRDAIPTQDQLSSYQISFELTSDGSDKFFNYTGANIGRPMAIVLDGVVLSVPVIQAAIQGNGVITGKFTQEEANSLAVQMRYGSLPVPLKVVDIRTIGASLGQDSVAKSLRAGLIGIVAVLIFMLALYRLPGVIASIALICYVILNLTIFKVLPVTLTLPGIAGFVLSIGMAVDANILIFERLKEELRNGRSLRSGVEAAFVRAWPAIFDSNLTTLISCAVLLWFGRTFGASTVSGFAINLGIGVLLSMFSAVVITRSIVRGLIGASGRSLAEARTAIGY